MPINEKKYKLFKLVSKKPSVPSKKEINENNRSRSAKLRYAIRSDESFFYPNDFTNKFINYFNLESLENAKSR